MVSCIDKLVNISVGNGFTYRIKYLNILLNSKFDRYLKMLNTKSNYLKILIFNHLKKTIKDMYI